MIKFQNLYKTFPNGTIGLQGCSGIIEDTGIHLIMGRSGAGKTTLLQILAMLDTYDTGELTINDLIVANMSENKKALTRRSLFGFVFQSAFLQEQLTALENVMLPLLAQEKLSMEKMIKRSTSLLQMVGMEKRLTHYPKQLSGGEQQRVAIARAMANDPAYIFADEPTSNLDEENAMHILELFRDFSKTRAIILVSHDSITEGYADICFDMKDGMIKRRLL